MGRPLKIAKATLLTLTGTGASTEAVTVSQTLSTLGIVAGTPFVPATTVGGLTGGTTYWVLEVTGASTFTVSATQPSANPTNTPVNLSGTSGQSVILSCGIVDSGFQNPDSTAQSGGTSTNPGASYGVVGGNTGIYSTQTVTRVAVGVTGSGALYSSSGNANVFGTGTDFANTLSAGSAIQVAVANVNGSTDFVNLGFVSGSVAGYANIELSNATATGNFLTSVGNAQTLFASQPVVLSANIGGLTAGTTYFVKTIANAAAFSVSLTAGGANVALVDEDATSYAVQDRVVLTANAAVNASAASFVYANDEAGYIVRQKGKQKYLVTGLTSGLTAQCYTANVANAALTPNTMSILSTDAASGTAYVQSLSDYNTLLFNNSEANIQNATPVTATFGTAYAANTYGGQPLPIVTINNA
jgi:hypothetical protein